MITHSYESEVRLAQAIRAGHRNRPAPIEDLLHIWVRNFGGSYRMVPAHHATSDGVSDCRVCGKTIIRGQGRWWDR
jgi:hypothetical protein